MFGKLFGALVCSSLLLGVNSWNGWEKKKKNSDQCQKYEQYGETAVKGCEGCAQWYPERVDECMGCGKTCGHICPKGSDVECYKGEEFVSCHKSCMGKREDEHKKKDVDPKDCYFDKECHGKVNWDKVGEMKKLFFAKLKEMKSSGDTDIKPHWIRMHRGCVQAGMPEDRVDYMLKKWVKYVYPEVVQPEKDSKDCYFDKECHGKVNWDKVGEMKKLFFAKLKEMKSSGDKDIKPHWIRMHRGCVQAGMPGDRVDYMLKKWVKYVYPEVMQPEKDEHKQKEVDPKDCYFDKECQGKVNWDKVGEMKKLFFAKLKEMKSSGDKDIKPHWIRMHRGCVQAGMPEDRVDYMLKKWVEWVYPEAFNVPKDCYSDKECHAKVNWDKVGELKDPFFAKLKEMKSKGDRDIKPLWMHVHHACVQAGMPEDRVDYMLKKWVKYAYPEIVEPEKDQCSKYEQMGGVAFKGCQGCAKYYPGQVEKCMNCGRPCDHICPDKTWECYTGKDFGDCHKQCMAPSEVIV